MTCTCDEKCIKSYEDGFVKGRRMAYQWIVEKLLRGEYSIKGQAAERLAADLIFEKDKP